MAGASQIAAAKWIEIRPARIRTDLASAQQHFGLGTGELSIIMLGQELNIDVVLIDDMKARKLAQKEGLAVLGYRQLLASGAYVDRALLENILKILNLPPL
jgi:predicted nucleic acid-binding protein